MNLNLVEAPSPLRATFVSGERTRRRHQRFMGPMRFKKKSRLPMNRVGTRSTASVTLDAKNSDAVERVPTPNWFMVPMRARSGWRLRVNWVLRLNFCLTDEIEQRLAEDGAAAFQRGGVSVLNFAQ